MGLQQASSSVFFVCAGTVEAWDILLYARHYTSDKAFFAGISETIAVFSMPEGLSVASELPERSPAVHSPVQFLPTVGAATALPGVVSRAGHTAPTRRRSCTPPPHQAGAGAQCATALQRTS